MATGRQQYGWSSSFGSEWTDQKGTKDDYFPNFAFSQTSIRNQFIQKVFSIVTVQLAVTIGFIALFQFHDGSLVYALKNQWILNLAMISTLALTLLMSFSTSIRREAPLNIIVLGLYTVAQGFMIGLLTSFYDIDDVFYAIGLTAAIVFGLAVYASSTKEDFTMKGGMIASALMALTVGSLISIFYRGEFFNLLLSVGFAGIFSMYLVYDLQMIMGSKSLSISAEEYIFAALSLYVDIIRIFMELLKILRYINESSNENQRRRKRN